MPRKSRSQTSDLFSFVIWVTKWGTLNRSLQNGQLLPTQDGKCGRKRRSPVCTHLSLRVPETPPLEIHSFRSNTAPSRVLLTFKCQRDDVDISSSKECVICLGPRDHYKRRKGNACQSCLSPGYLEGRGIFKAPVPS